VQPRTEVADTHLTSAACAYDFLSDGFDSSGLLPRRFAQAPLNVAAHHRRATPPGKGASRAYWNASEQDVSIEMWLMWEVRPWSCAVASQHNTVRFAYRVRATPATDTRVGLVQLQ
jgi:hypothetical protein